MTKFYSLLLASALVFAYSCKTASKSYQKGNYTDAIERGVKKLQKDPYDYDTRDLVQRSYNYAVNGHEDQIRILNNSREDSRYERIYNEYLQLQNLYQSIHEYPAVAQIIKTKDYSEYVNTYRDKAAQVHIDMANKWMEEGNKKAYREAYREYNMALNLRSEDFDLKKKRDQAFDSALTRVVITNMQNPVGYYGYSSQLQNFQRDIMRSLSYNMSNSFVKFYAESEARSQKVTPDEVMELNLARISLGQSKDDKSSREVSKEVVIKEIVYKPDSVVNQYGTVKARITSTKRTLLSQGDLLITLRDPMGRVIWNDRFTGEHSWNTEFASFTGDERALSDTDKAQINKASATPPTEEKIMELLLQQIRSDLSSRLRNYYASNQ